VGSDASDDRQNGEREGASPREAARARPDVSGGVNVARCCGSSGD